MFSKIKGLLTKPSTSKVNLYKYLEKYNTIFEPTSPRFNVRCNPANYVIYLYDYHRMKMIKAIQVSTIEDAQKTIKVMHNLRDGLIHELGVALFEELPCIEPQDYLPLRWELQQNNREEWFRITRV